MRFAYPLPSLMLGGLVIFLAICATPQAFAQSSTGATIDLQTQLEVGLRAARPSEFAFIQVVVRRVADGTLPYPMVQSTFLWARHQQPRPMVYFQQALIVRAGRIGVRL